MVTKVRQRVAIEVVQNILRRKKYDKVDEAVEELKKLPVRQPKQPVPEGGISISAASRKYRIPKSTLIGWVERDFIPILLKTSKAKYIDEAALARVKSIFKRNPGQGKWTVKQVMEAGG